MAVWALADLHLSWGTPEKTMSLFGPIWDNYMETIEQNWRNSVNANDLVLIAGDISWAMHLEQALIDLKWLDTLPGTKVIIRGNHDYWWSSFAKVTAALPPSIHAIQNNAFVWNEFSIGGARLWDTEEYAFNHYIALKENPLENKDTQSTQHEQEKIFQRELHRLELSLQALTGEKRLVMTHYPPIGPDYAPSRVSALLEKYNVSLCVFGHLHNLKPGVRLFGETHRGVRYELTACDYLHFKPIKLF